MFLDNRRDLYNIVYLHLKIMETKIEILIFINRIKIFFISGAIRTFQDLEFFFRNILVNFFKLF